MAPEAHAPAMPGLPVLTQADDPHYGHVLPLIDGDKTYAQVTEEVFGTTERKPPLKWWLALSLAV